MTMPSARMALAAALVMCAGLDPRDARIVRIRDTLQLRELWISEPMLPLVQADPALAVAGELTAFPLAGE